MKRKQYRKPTMKVVKLRHKCQILAGSVLNASRADYGTANESTWGDEE